MKIPEGQTTNALRTVTRRTAKSRSPPAGPPEGPEPSGAFSASSHLALIRIAVAWGSCEYWWWKTRSRRRRRRFAADPTCNSEVKPYSRMMSPEDPLQAPIRPKPHGRRGAHPQRLRLLPSGSNRPPRGPQVPRIVALLVATSGIITLLSAAASPLSGRIRVFTEVVPLAVRTGATSVAALAGLAVLAVAGGLARRQRRAWWIALTFLILAGVAHVLKNVDVFEAGLDLGLAAVLVIARQEFDARPSPGSIRKGLLTLPLLSTAVWLFGWLALLFHADGLRPQLSAGRAAVVAARGIFGLPLGIAVVGPTGRWIPGLLPLLGVFVVVAAVVATLRPIVEGQRRTPDDAKRAREIVGRSGSDTLAYFALREDKSYFFSGDAVIAYRYIWNLGLISGDPIGPVDDAVGAIEGFVRYARDRGWGVAVLAAGEEMGPIYEKLGLRSFYLGDEAVLDPTSFSLDGRHIRKVRQSCHRLERLGYSLDFLDDDEITPDLQDALDDIGRSWRGRAPERGFTMALGRLPSALDSEAKTVVARDMNGRAAGYLHLVPCNGERPGYSVDQMRRRPCTPNGLMEWVVAQTAIRLKDQGVTRFSLNFALLGGLFEKGIRLSLFQRLELMVARRLNPFFQIERLRNFNAKFSPDWIPRYIYYEPPFGFPRVALAYLEAEAFLRLPIIGAGARARSRR